MSHYLVAFVDKDPELLEDEDQAIWALVGEGERRGRGARALCAGGRGRSSVGVGQGLSGEFGCLRRGLR